MCVWPGTFGQWCNRCRLPPENLFVNNNLIIASLINLRILIRLKKGTKLANPCSQSLPLILLDVIVYIFNLSIPTISPVITDTNHSVLPRNDLCHRYEVAASLYLVDKLGFSHISSTTSSPLLDFCSHISWFVTWCTRKEQANDFDGSEDVI